MRRRDIPRWFRTALVFLASLQAARAGSVEAQNLGNHRVERATAALAPREPLPSIRVAAPVVLALAPTVAVVEAPRAVAHAANVAVPRAEPAASSPASHDAMAADGWRPAVYREEIWVPRGSGAALALPPARGPYQARAPCLVPNGN